MKPVQVTSWTSVNCLGAGNQAIARRLRKDVSGLSPCEFETVTLKTYTGMVEGVQEFQIRRDLAEFSCRNNQLAQMALEQDKFIEAACAVQRKFGASRVGVFVGTSTSGILSSEIAYRHRDPETGALPDNFHFSTTHDMSSLSEFVRRYLGLDGLTFTVSSACSSSAKVFGTAARMIEAGVCDAAIVGGADSLCLTTLYGFNSLELISESPCRPFDKSRDGISIGEAAGFALLERPTNAVPAEAIYLLGVGESSDAYHMSSPHPEGRGAQLAMERALKAAELTTTSVDYVNLHGTATKMGDAAEDRAMCATFGTRTPCSSTKGYTGHTLGASGIAEAIISIECILGDFMPGSTNTETLDPSVKSNYLLKSREANVNIVMTNSFGFGGNNCSLILGRM